jgi:CxxC motif-containing protein (DUF1111 family)
MRQARMAPATANTGLTAGVSLGEAIMWHDGEAKSSKDNFSAMSQSDRDALIRFLKTL